MTPHLPSMPPHRPHFFHTLKLSAFDEIVTGIKRMNPFGDDTADFEKSLHAMKRLRLDESSKERVALDTDTVVDEDADIEDAVAAREKRDRSLLEEYEQYKAEISGTDRWNEEQSKVHKLIWMRGEQPMLDHHWRWDLKPWGVDPVVFCGRDDPRELPITNIRIRDSGTLTRNMLSAEVIANLTPARHGMEALFNITLRVRDRLCHDESRGDIYEKYQQRAITRIILTGLKAYIKWAKRDAGVLQKDFPDIVIVRAYPLDFTGPKTTKVKIEREEEYTPFSECAPLGAADGDGTNEGVRVKQEDGIEKESVNDSTEGERGVGLVAEDIERRLHELAAQHRAFYESKTFEGVSAAAARPPTLYAFAVLAHMAMLVSLDAAVTDSPLVVLDTIPFGHPDQWLWNALSIALPMNMVRDSMYARASMYDDLPPESDPDL